MFILQHNAFAYLYRDFIGFFSDTICFLRWFAFPLRVVRTTPLSFWSVSADSSRVWEKDSMLNLISFVQWRFEEFLTLFVFMEENIIVVATFPVRYPSKRRDWQAFVLHDIEWSIDVLSILKFCDTVNFDK